MSIAELIEQEKEVLRQEYNLKLKEIEEKLEYGSYGKIDWLTERTGLSTNTLKDKILYPFREELEGNIVFYSDRPGIPWRFNKYLMNQWLLENFERIDWS